MHIYDGYHFWGEPVISTEISKVKVRVIKTNEELMIAKMVCDVLNYSIKK